jgi:hypothetical protein
MDNNISDSTQDNQTPGDEGVMHLSHSEGTTIQPLNTNNNMASDVPATAPSAPLENTLLSNPDPAPAFSKSPVQDNSFTAAPIEPHPPGAIITGDFSPAQASGPTAAPIIGDVGPTAGPGSQQPTAMPAPAPANDPKKSRNYKKLSKYMAMTLVVLIVLGGASAAAFFGYIRPHQPAYILRSALINTIKQNQYDFNANINSSGGAGDPAFKLGLSGEAGKQSKNAEFNLNFDVSGITVTAQAKYVNQNLYVKVGDLSSLTSLAAGADPTLGTLAQQVSSQVSNKWIEIDSTILDEGGVNCFSNENLNISNSEISSLENLYNKNQFTNIKSTTNTTLNGQAVEEFNIAINDNKGASFLNSLNSLSQVKKLESCTKTSQSDGLSYSSQNIKGDGKTTDVQVWVNKKTKLLQQLSTKINSDSETGTISLGLGYHPVNVTAPASSTPILTVIGQVEQDFDSGTGTNLDLGSLFGGSTGAGLSTPGSTNFLSD